MASVTLYPNSFVSSTFTTSSNTSNGCTSTSSTTYATFTLETTQKFAYYSFDTSAIPSNVTINSVSCSIKVTIPNDSNYNTAQLYSGTTAKGSSTSLSKDTASTVSLTPGSWTRSELDNIQLVLGGGKGVKHTRIAYFYGADLTIDYTSLVYHNLTITNNSSYASVTNYEQSIPEGGNSTITLNITSINDIILFDNGTNVTSSLVNTSGTTYTYTITDIQGDHTVIINDKVSYTITSNLNTNLVDAISPSGQTTVYGGENYTLILGVDSVDLIEVVDNNVDVTSSLVRENNETVTSGNQNTVLGEYTLVSGSFNRSGANYFSGIVGNGVDATQTTSNYYSGGSGTIAVFNYKLVFSNIPSNAVITRLYCEVNGHAQSTSNSSEYMCVQLRSGDTELSEELNFKSVGTSNSTQTIEATTLPTVAQLENLVLYCRLGYYGGAINGATCYIEYTTTDKLLNTNTQYVWTYTLNNVSASHIININELVGVITHTVTITNNNTEVTISQSSLIVREGNSAVISFTTSRGEGVILKDNGTDVTSSLTNSDTTYSYTITNILADHTITISEKYWYEITTECTYANASVSVSNSKVYEGNNVTVTVNVSNISLVDVKDNGVNLTLTSSGTNTYIATITNVTDDHEIVVLEANSYSVTALSNTNNATITTSGVSSVLDGNDITFTLTSDVDWSLIILKDNGVDVTSSIVHNTGSASSGSPTFIPSSFDSTNSSYDSIYTGTADNGLTAHTDSNRFCVYSNTGSGAESYLYYNFDCSSIPANATITSVSCTAAASCYSSGSYFATKELQLCTGTTEKGNSVTVTGNGSTSSTHTFDGGSWTRAELNNIKIRFKVVRSTSNTTTEASFSFFGATLTVNYETAGESYTYTITDVGENHTVSLFEVFVPEEEDETKTYHSITISSINATTNPGSGTIRVEEGTNQTISISLDEPQITVVTDNGVDITNDLVISGGTPSYTVTGTVSGASYGFELNNSTGYYTSNNAAQASTAAVCRVNFNLPETTLITIEYINYAESTYDYGIFGKVDTALGTTNSADSDPYKSCSGESSASAVTLTYEIEAGEHFIDIKYLKDSSQDSNNDNLQWKITNMQLLSINEYTYTLTNITEDHNLIFIFGEVVYYTNTASGTGCRLYPTGNYVTLPNESYSVTVIPDKSSYNIVLYDNGRDVSSKLEYLNSDGSVSYVYTIKKVTTDHTITVTCESSQIIYQKISNAYIAFSKVYKKISGYWVEQDDYRNLFESNKIYFFKEYNESITVTHSFNGYKIAPGNTYYDGSSFQISDNYSNSSYGQKYGKTAGSYYFDGADTQNLSIVYNGDTYITPSRTVFNEIIGLSGSRNGSTVNNIQNVKYALIETTETVVRGLLIFPDNETFTGGTLTAYNSTSSNSSLTYTELNNYIDNGCAFLKCNGEFEDVNSSAWFYNNQFGRYVTSTSAGSYSYYNLFISVNSSSLSMQDDRSGADGHYMCCRMVSLIN